MLLNIRINIEMPLRIVKANKARELLTEKNNNSLLTVIIAENMFS